IGLHHLQSEGDNEFDGNFTNEADFYQQVSGGKVTWEATDAWTVTARAGINKDESENEINGVFASRFDSQRITRSLQSDYRLTDDQLVTLGYDFHDDQIDSSNAFVETSRRNEGVFGQYQTQIGQWSLQASGRRDSNEQFGSHETGSLAIGYSADNGVNTLVSHGTAYKAPTFNELYFPFFGNPGLDPEESRSTELGFSGSTDRYDWSANFFHTSVDELISFDSVIFAPANLSEATIRGAEFQLRTEIAGWSIDSLVSFLDAKNNDSGANNDKLLPRRARRSLRIDADQSAGQWHYGGTLIARGRAYDDLANTDSIGGFVTLDLRTAYQLNRQFQLQLKVNNLLDKKYSTASQFNQDGTHLMMTLRWQQPG
ncbi:MAG: TonB-dependent receptor, partial [Gammaproteobacteria bacterium]